MAINMQDLYTRSPGVAKTEAPATAEASQAGLPTREAQASTAGSKAAQAANATAAGYTATTQDVSPEALASTQATKILAEDSPLMQRARQEGILTAGRRGLQNSSIAAGTAQGAMADRAIPLAQQNAQTVFQQGLANQTAENRAKEVTAGFGQEAEMQRAALETNVSQFNAAAENEAAKLNAQLQTAVEQGNVAAENAARQQLADLETRVNQQNAEFQQQTSMANATAENQMRERVVQANADLNKQYLAGTQAMDLATIQGQYNQLISTNETAARMYDSYFNSISQAMANKDISPDRIAQYVGVQQTMLEAGLRMMDQMNSLNLNTALPTFGVTGTGAGARIEPTGGTTAAQPVAAPATATTVQNAAQPAYTLTPVYDNERNVTGYRTPTGEVIAAG